MKRVVIGLVGPIASGKGFLAEFLIKKGFAYWSLSDRVREETDRRGLPRERGILQDIGNELRLSFGPVVLVRQTLALISDAAELVIIDSIRNPMELDFLKALGTVIVGVDASVENRLGWYLERAKKGARMERRRRLFIGPMPATWAKGRVPTASRGASVYV